jgi:hypothetical protein
MSAADDFTRLIREGKIAEAKAMLGRELERSRYSPTRIETGKDGRARFYHGKTRVEHDIDGNWKPAKTSIPRKA